MTGNNKEGKKENETYLCLCTKNLQCSDLIGQTKPFSKSDKSKSNEILTFTPGFLINTIKKGIKVVLDCINEANSIVGERLKGLLDKKIMMMKKFLICLKILGEIIFPFMKIFEWLQLVI